MNINGEVTVKACRETVFDAIRNAQFFTLCIDGLSELTEIDPTNYAAVMETKVSFMKFKFKVTVQLVRIDSPREIEAKIEGRLLGFLGRLTAVSVTTLTETDDETRIRYTIEAALTGKLGSLGQSAFLAKAKQMSKQFGDNLRAALESRTCEVVG